MRGLGGALVVTALALAGCGVQHRRSDANTGAPDAMIRDPTCGCVPTHGCGPGIHCFTNDAACGVCWPEGPHCDGTTPCPPERSCVDGYCDGTCIGDLCNSPTAGCFRSPGW